MSYYDRNGAPLNVRDWAASFETSDRTIENTKDGDVTISTVYVGINMNFHDDGPPLIYETMIFGGPFDGETWRYATEAEARQGHTEAVKRHNDTEETA